MPLDPRAVEIDGLRFEDGPGGLVRGVVATAACEGAFTLHGAQVTRWRPAGHDDVLWLSPNATYEDGRAIRGGIPICFPWFGAHPSDPAKPSHGLTRTHAWSLAAVERRGDAVVVALEARIEEWACRLTASFGAELVTTLTVRNESAAPASFEAALHAYFAISDITEVLVAGLEDAPYLDMAAGNASRAAEGAPIRFSGEVDRLYLGRPDSTVTIEDAARTIELADTNARSTVVWNPGIEKARGLADLGEVEWRRMVCVETANVRGDAVTLVPGETSALSSAVRVRPRS